MRDNSSVRRRVEPTESLFLDTEGPSFCLRPTGLVPPTSNELRDFGPERFGLVGYALGPRLASALSELRARIAVLVRTP
jgi:hypothetical protein